jgi:response regulator RpfG family c-di-GMP phosphodiesterase
MDKALLVYLIGATSDEFHMIQKYLPEWVCENVLLNNEGTAFSSQFLNANLIIVYAHNNEKVAFSICEQIRNSQENLNIPILLVISRYQIYLGNDVKRMGNAAFIFSPFSGKELESKITGLLEDS